MHELSLLLGVADRIGEVVRENGIDHVDAVVLEVGEVTGIIPLFLEDGYSVLKDEYDFLKDSVLIIDTVKGIAKCLDCGAEYEIVRNKGVCPSCGSRNKDVLKGRDFFIKEIRIYEDPQN